MMSVPLILHAAIETGDELLYDLGDAHSRTAERTLVRPDGGHGCRRRSSEPRDRRVPRPRHAGRLRHRHGLGPRPGLGHLRVPLGLPLYERPGRPRGRRALRRLLPDAVPRRTGPALGFRHPARPRAARRQLGRRDRRLGPARPRDADGRPRLRQPTVIARPRKCPTPDPLCTDRYLAWSVPDWEGVVRHGVYRFHEHRGVDESLIWGDYYFLEAVAKALHAA